MGVILQDVVEITLTSLPSNLSTTFKVYAAMRTSSTSVTTGWQSVNVVAVILSTLTLKFVVEEITQLKPPMVPTPVVVVVLPMIQPRLYVVTVPLGRLMVLMKVRQFVVETVVSTAVCITAAKVKCTEKATSLRSSLTDYLVNLMERLEVLILKDHPL